MKLYISCDMEGVAGVCSWTHVDSSNASDYPTFRRYMTQEVRAAIDGARALDATDVLINDSHGAMHNLCFDELPHDIRVISGNRKPFSMVQGADASFDGAFFIGYHGGAGEANAVLSHTYTPSVIYDVHLNGMRCSEATINAALLGYHGVALMLVTGDRTTVESVQRQMPWVEGVIVKESIGNFSANSLAPPVAQRAIYEGTQRALARASEMKPFVVERPIVLDLQLCKAEQADLIELMPGFERTGGRNIRFVTDDMPTCFKAFVAAFRLGATA